MSAKTCQGNQNLKLNVPLAWDFEICYELQVPNGKIRKPLICGNIIKTSL